MESKLDNDSITTTLWIGEQGYHDGLHVLCREPRAMRKVLNFLATLTDEDLKELWYMNVDLSIKGDNDEQD